MKIALGFFALIVFLSGCVQQAPTEEPSAPTIKEAPAVVETPAPQMDEAKLPETETPMAEMKTEETPTTLKEVMKSARPWMDIVLTDAKSGEKFTIGQFKGKPILLESFAVWCPTCLVQQQKMNELREREGEAIVHISLDTDPNEDVNKVRAHVNRNGFEWYFAVSPIELTNALIEDYGLGIVNAPAAPVLLICEDQTTRFLTRGVKSPDALLQEVNKGC